MIAIWIEPHERHEAIEAYRDRLTQDQVEQIKNAHGDATIQLHLNICGDPTLNNVIVPKIITVEN